MLHKYCTLQGKQLLPTDVKKYILSCIGFAVSKEEEKYMKLRFFFPLNEKKDSAKQGGAIHDKQKIGEIPAQHAL